MTICMKWLMFNRLGVKTTDCHCSHDNWLYMLAQTTDGAARAIVRNEDTENRFAIWRRLHKQFSLPERARATNLLNEIIGFR